MVYTVDKFKILNYYSALNIAQALFGIVVLSVAVCA